MRKFQYFLLMIVAGCSTKKENFPQPSPSTASQKATSISLSREEYYDKVLGMLVGSAIGDAMGAPTEMWDRHTINIQKGYVDSMDLVLREKSPEGPWLTNMMGGSTTDDTRWKYLGIKYLLNQSADSLNPVDFARKIVEVYNQENKVLRDEANTYEQTEEKFSHITWLIEWVRVAKPFIENDLVGYNNSLSKFYGGEMSCAGMLYAPVIGAYFPGNPDKSYRQGFGLSIFDIGYARDITALTAAYVSKAMQPGVSLDQITGITREVDPENYFNSRLIGRLAHKALEQAKQIVFESRKLSENEIPVNQKLPVNFKGTALQYAQLQKAYSLLENRLQDIPFHAAEIHLINLTALEFSQGDFMVAMEFVTNFGRDNDTVGAVTGAILGAKLGVKNLPPQLVTKSLQTNKNIVGIDLELLATELVNHRLGKASN